MAGRRLANSLSSERNRSSAFSGRSARGSVSHWAPPTAPSSTASACLRQFQRRIRQRMLVRLIGRAAHRSRFHLDFEAEILAQALENLDRLGHHFGADAVARQYRNLFGHRSSFISRTATALLCGAAPQKP